MGILAPVKLIQNGYILADGDVITAIGSNKAIPTSYELVDLGDSIICPPLVNAHTHLQLSWLAQRLRWGSGFAEWLKSLLAELLPVIRTGYDALQQEACNAAILALAAYGTATVGSVEGNLPGASLSRQVSGMQLFHFCEWFGFEEVGESPWPARCRAELERDTELAGHCAPAGHALYSTSGELLRKAHHWCASTNRKFTFHLAESPEETEMLISGTGALAGLYRGNVLPEDWRPFGATPFQTAMKYELLDKSTLAVHGVQLARDEIRPFAASGSALCLCPRSNKNIGVGMAPVLELLEAGALLCLGTDGLTSCEDLDVRKDALYLRQSYDLPLVAVLRMAIPNGRQALGLPPQELKPGQRASFSIWPLDEALYG